MELDMTKHDHGVADCPPPPPPFNLDFLFGERRAAPPRYLKCVYPFKQISGSAIADLPPVVHP